MGTMEEDFMKMNSDGYEEQYERYCRGIENSSSHVKLSMNNGCGICDTCIKEDVCMLSRDLHKAVDDIKEIAERKGVFIDVDVKCKKWFEKDTNFR